jgi:hypothetical protein
VPFEPCPAGLRVRIRLTPKASRTAIRGVEADAAGRARLKVHVTAAPQKGKANAALLKALAKAWSLPIRDLSLLSGQSNREKVIVVAGEPAALSARLAAWRHRFEEGVAS